jgi:hypothetical protein
MAPADADGYDSGISPGQPVRREQGMKRSLLALAAVGLLGLMGCPHDEFTVDLSPGAGGMNRTIVVSLGRSETQAASQIALLEKAYNQTATASAPTTQSFKSVFATKMPDDVGNAGLYLDYSSSMGKVGVYAERYRGDMHVAAQLQERFVAVDRATDLIIGWLKSEIGTETGFDKLQTFLDKQVRDDLKDLAVYAWTSKLVENSNDELLALVARAGLFLNERGYLEPGDLATFVRSYSLKATNQGSERALWALAVRNIRAGMGLAGDQPAPAGWMLADWDRAAASLDAYLKTTPEYAVKLKAFQAAQPATAPAGGESPPAGPPAGRNVITELVGAIFDFQSGGGPSDDTLAVSLKLTTKPASTNGKWDEQAGNVTWHAALDSREAQATKRYPFVCDAIWAVPDAKFQEQHFGKVVFAGWDLIRYGLWHKGLTDAERLVWDEFVAGLRPGKDLAEKLHGFLFADEKLHGVAPENSLARDMVNIIFPPPPPQQGQQ